MPHSPVFDRPLHVGRPHGSGREAFFKLAGEMFDRGWLTNDGPLVNELEQRIASYLGVRHCVAMANGTIALEIAIRALGLKGEVIIPSFTFVATAHALQWHGITPVFADIDPETHNIDPADVRRKITTRTSGILGVHLWGRPAPAADLQAIADAHGLPVLYDAAHAFGCSHQGRMVGGFGRAEVLSFHATKCFSTFEGGAVVTNEDDLAGTMRSMRNFGFSGRDHVVSLGINGKMPEICAAMGLANLGCIDTVIEANLRSYETYRAVLARLPGLRLLPFDAAERNNYQYVVVEVDEDCAVSRDTIIEGLRAENVLARRYFWPGCHRMKPYCDLFPHADLTLPNTRIVADRVIVLPTGTALPEGAAPMIAAIIERLLAAGQ